MTEQARPGGRPVVILDIPLTDARPRPSAPDARTDTAPARTPEAPAPRPAIERPSFRPEVPDTAPSAPAPVRDVPPSTSGWVSDAEEEEADGQWYVTRPLTAARPRTRARAASPTGRAHLVAAAVSVPVAGASGILVTVVDTLSTALAAVLPIASVLGVAAAWLFLSRLGAWVRARIGAAVAVLRR